MISSSRLLRLPACAVALLFFVSEPARADNKVGAVQGKVTVEGKPLAEGKIIFHLGNGQFVGSTVNNGNYKIDVIPAGAYKITVEGAGVAERYNSEKTTPLTVMVDAGKQNVDVDLTK
jgi:hypothetical protein